MTTAAIIVAAGRGSRFGGALPKQYTSLFGRPVLGWTIEALSSHSKITEIVLVIHPDDQDLLVSLVDCDGLQIVHGGQTRQASVRAGLDCLEGRGITQVLIHDAARPFVSHGMIDRVLAGLETYDGALPALKVTDSLRVTENNLLKGSIPRDGVVRAQTPQGFRYDAILTAHRQTAHENYTDDVEILAMASGSVLVVDGDEGALKVTTTDDLVRLEQILLARLSDVRTASGFDVHKFTDGDHVTLCGVRIPHSQALLGHSDADVGLHALTDALLGTIAEGDIGAVFPPSEEKWKGADSALFLAHARDRIAARGGLIAHVDVTLMCERPKIGPHREAMRQRIADILRIDNSRVSVKATTTEGLGFTGRREGIAAMAQATVRLSV